MYVLSRGEIGGFFPTSACISVVTAKASKIPTNMASGLLPPRMNQMIVRKITYPNIWGYCIMLEGMPGPLTSGG